MSFQKVISFREYENINLEDIKIGDIIRGKKDNYKILEVHKCDFVIRPINSYDRCAYVVHKYYLSI